MKPLFSRQLCVITIAASSCVNATLAQSPSVRVSQVNTDTVKKYEKFEIHLELSGVDIRNPYDPGDIDLYAQFESPVGKSIRINGFDDNYHNAIWATLSNGLAGIPVWWQFRHMSARDWDHLQHLATFVAEIDFANQPYNLAAISAEGADAYALISSSLGFGWVRSYAADKIGGTRIVIEGLGGDSLEVSWFDTWSGVVMNTETHSVDDGKLSIAAPTLPTGRPDIAFKINRSVE